VAARGFSPISVLFLSHWSRPAPSSRLELEENPSRRMHTNFPADALGWPRSGIRESAQGAAHPKLRSTRARLPSRSRIETVRVLRLPQARGRPPQRTIRGQGRSTPRAIATWTTVRSTWISSGMRKKPSCLRGRIRKIDGSGELSGRIAESSPGRRRSRDWPLVFTGPFRGGVVVPRKAAGCLLSKPTADAPERGHRCDSYLAGFPWGLPFWILTPRSSMSSK